MVTRVYYPYSNFDPIRPKCSDVWCKHPAKFQFTGPYWSFRTNKDPEKLLAIYFVCGVHVKRPLIVIPSMNLREAEEWQEFSKPTPLDLTVYEVVTHPEKGSKYGKGV